MKERPILFNAEMVQAILAGRKTETRRLIKPQPVDAQIHTWKGETLYDGESRHLCWKGHVFGDAAWDFDENRVKLAKLSPFGAAGDQLWLRETFQHTGRGKNCIYNADQVSGAANWTPSIHMPRWASRIDLLVKRVWVERVQEISGEDAEDAEGIGWMWDNHEAPTCRFVQGCYNPIEGWIATPDSCDCSDYDAVETFAKVWDSIYAAKGYGWGANPWVWCCEFERVEV